MIKENTDDLYYIKFHTHWFVYRSWPHLTPWYRVLQCRVALSGASICDEEWLGPNFFSPPFAYFPFLSFPYSSAPVRKLGSLIGARLINGSP